MPPAALLLLPGVKDADRQGAAHPVRLLLRGAPWQDEARRWGLADAPDARMVVTDDAGAALRSGAEVVLLVGADRRHRLRRAGYRTRAFTARRVGAGATALVPVGDRAAAALVPFGPRTPRALAVVAVRRATRARAVLAQRSWRPPAVLEAAGASGPFVLVAGGGGPRRRSVFLVAGPPGDGFVVKTAAAADAARGDGEQRVLARLRDAGLGRGAPSPAGQGVLGRIAFTAESRARGTVLSELLGAGSRDAVLAVLADVTSWSADMAARTGRPRRWHRQDAADLPLHGEHVALAPLLDGLHGVPQVLAHRDLGAAHNLLVDDRRWTAVDWETAREDALPMLDVLPLLCGSLAALAGHRTPDASAAYVLGLCGGSRPDSDWLLGQVRGYLQRAGVPLAAAGSLAALAFGYQASMRVEHERLVRAAGDEPVAWRSAWDTVAAQWGSGVRLGRDWEALAQTPAGVGP